MLRLVLAFNLCFVSYLSFFRFFSYFLILVMLVAPYIGFAEGWHSADCRRASAEG
jgi:hypothetical protein